MARVIQGGARVIRRAVVDATERAEAIVANAHAEAAALREAIRAEVEADAAASARAELAAAMISVEVAREEAVEAVRGSIAELAIAVARRLIADDLEAHPERVRELVTEAMGRVARAGRTVVRAHPADLEFLEGLPAEVIGDDTLQRGDCVVEADLGDVDARVTTKLARALAALEGSS